MTPRATFAIPCYNAGPHLETLLRSLAAQSCCDFALLLVDDASDDDSLVRAESWAKTQAQATSPLLRVVRNERRLGIGGNWNRCIELSESEFVCLAHQDDVYGPRYLERMLAALDEDPDAMAAHCRVTAIDAAGRAADSDVERYKQRFWAAPPRSAKEQFRSLFEGNFVNCPTILWRRESLNGAPFSTHMRYALDWAFVLERTGEGARIVHVDEELVSYRRHDGAASRAAVKSYDRYREEHEVLARAKERGVELGWLDPDAKSHALRNNLLFDVLQDLRRGRRDQARERLAWVSNEAYGLEADSLVRCVRLALRLGPLARPMLELGLKARLAR